MFIYLMIHVLLTSSWYLVNGFGNNDSGRLIENDALNQLYNSQILSWDLFPVPAINAMYSYDQSAVRILLNFIRIQENYDRLSKKHLDLIKNYIYEWKSNIQEPLEENHTTKWNENTGTFHNHIPKSLNFPDIILRIVIRVQQDLITILNFSEDIHWKEKVVEKVYEAEAVSGVDSQNLLERELAANSLAILSSTYNLHPYELFTPNTTTEKRTNLVVSFASAAVFPLKRVYFTIALEWISAAISILSGESNRVWKEIQSQNKDLRTKYPTDEYFSGKVQHFREKYEISRINHTKRELKKLDKILGDERPFRTNVSKDSQLENWKDRSDLLYFKIFNDAISVSHDQHWNLSKYENYLSLFPKLLSQQNITLQSNKVVKEKHMRSYETKSNERRIRLNQDKLCRGIDSQSSKELSQYLCYLDSRNSSYLILMPAKVEALNKDPEILIFHHIVGKNIEEHHQFDLPFAKAIDRSSSTESGLSYISNFDSQISERTKFLNHLIGAMSGYIVPEEFGGSEPFMMNSYNAGGMVSPHIDAYGVYDETFNSTYKERSGKLMHYLGDRIANFIFFMNDNLIGGRTAFPLLKLSVKPESGSALYWTSLHLNGSVNKLSLHAGCPVLSGIKLSAVKVIRSNAQMFRKPCGLSKNM